MKLFKQVESKTHTAKESYDEIIYKKGITGLWRGNTIGLINQGLCSGIKFYFSHKINQYLGPKKHRTPLEMAATGAISGLISQVSMYPLDFIRTRMIISPDKYKGFFQSCALVYKEQGFSGFWTGLKPTIVGAIPYESSNHLIYSWLKQQSFIKTNKVATIPRNLLFGTIAGIVSQALAYPFETVRRRMMVCESDGKPKYNSMKECFQKTYKEEGIKAFYKGIGVNTVKCIPYSALQYALYEEMLKVEDYLIKKF